MEFPNSSLRLQPARTGGYPTNRTRSLRPLPADFKQEDFDFLQLIQSILSSCWQRIGGMGDSQRASSDVVREHSRVPKVMYEYSIFLDDLIALQSGAWKAAVAGRESSSKIIDQMTQLHKGWDGNVGVALSVDIATVSKQVLRMLERLRLGQPFMYPSPTGGLIAEWEYKKGRITLHITRSDVQMFSIGPQLDYSVSEWSLDEPEKLLKAITQIREEVDGGLDSESNIH